MKTTGYEKAAAALGLLAVALGAFGAHALRDMLADNASADIWRTAVLYHFIHAVMAYVIALRTQVINRIAWWSFCTGIVLFSGSLYVMSVTQWKWLGPITPLGGVAFMVGWGRLLWSQRSSKSMDNSDSDELA